MGNKFDDFMYEKLQEIIDQHDNIIAEKCVQLEKDNDVLNEVIDDIKSTTIEWMTDIVMTAFTSPAELLRGRIYALVSSFPQNYTRKNKEK